MCDTMNLKSDRKNFAVHEYTMHEICIKIHWMVQKSFQATTSLNIYMLTRKSCQQGNWSALEIAREVNFSKSSS